jgi:hypothetical protein
VKVVEVNALEDTLSAKLSLEEMQDLFRLDILIKGKLLRPENPLEVWLAVEVSSVIDRNDVERAVYRARLLRKAGLMSIPAVAGTDSTGGAVQLAGEESVAILQDGMLTNWDQALRDHIAA